MTASCCTGAAPVAVNNLKSRKQVNSCPGGASMQTPIQKLCECVEAEQRVLPRAARLREHVFVLGAQRSQLRRYERRLRQRRAPVGLQRPLQRVHLRAQLGRSTAIPG